MDIETTSDKYFQEACWLMPDVDNLDLFEFITQLLSIMEYVPEEVIVQIFSYLNRKELLLKAALVCKKWNNLSLHPKLWKKVAIKFSSKRNIVKFCSFLQKVPFVEQLDLVDVFHCSHKSDSAESIALNELFKHLYKLKCLILNVDFDINVLPKSVKHFEINLLYLSDIQVYNVANQCKSLEKVALNNGDENDYTDLSVSYLLSRRKRTLTDLNLSLHGITNPTIYLLRDCCHLTSISLDSCNHINKEGISAIALNKPLNKLVLRHMDQNFITAFCEVLDEVKFKSLKYLALIGSVCTFTGTFLQRLTQSLPVLESFYTRYVPFNRKALLKFIDCCPTLQCIGIGTNPWDLDKVWEILKDFHSLQENRNFYSICFCELDWPSERFSIDTKSIETSLVKFATENFMCRDNSNHRDLVFTNICDCTK